jgi:hypothetical protein
VSPWLKFAATAADIVLITAVLTLSGRPRSPLLVLYFLVIGAAALRLSLELVYAATAGSILAYLFLLGHHAFYTVGYDRYYGSPELRIPRTQEVIFVLGLLAAGVLAGQVVRQARRLTGGYPAVADEAKEGRP